jgi:dethiobiotin synthetase
MKGVFVTGTDTDIGKTWVGKHLIHALRKQGADIIPRKPVESGWSDKLTETDAWILANAANVTERLNQVCPNRFRLPVSPVRAAKNENISLTLKTLKQQCLEGLDKKQFLYVEGAGGFYSPLCSDGLNADLAETLRLPILLVVANHLGCINHTLLNIEAIEKRGLTLKAVILNKSEPALSKQSDMDNLADLKKLLKYPILSISYRQKNQAVFDKLAHLFL